MNTQQEELLLGAITSLRSFNASIDDGRYPNELDHVIEKNEEVIEQLEKLYESFEK